MHSTVLADLWNPEEENVTIKFTGIAGGKFSLATLVKNEFGDGIEKLLNKVGTFDNMLSAVRAANKIIREVKIPVRIVVEGV